MSPTPALKLPSPAPRESGVALSTSRPSRFEAFGLSHRGLIRPSNEDSYLVAPELGICAVADGMGGAAAGEVASRMAIDAVRRAFENAGVSRPGAMNDLPLPAPGMPRLVTAIQHANLRVHATACADHDKAGMGTTFTALAVLEGRVGIAHVGDSRAYLLRGRKLEVLTEDHTLMEAYVRSGAMTRDEARRSTFGHAITRAVGTEPGIEVDQRLVATAAGDLLLLATDGLHGLLGHDDIAAILVAERDLTRAATHLIDAALDAGAPDNVTVVLARIA